MEGFSLLPTLCSHNKTVHCKDNTDPCIKRYQGNPLPHPQTPDLACHSIMVRRSHTTNGALHPLKTWHSCCIMLTLCLPSRVCVLNGFYVRLWLAQAYMYPSTNVALGTIFCHRAIRSQRQQSRARRGRVFLPPPRRVTVPEMLLLGHGSHMFACGDPGHWLHTFNCHRSCFLSCNAAVQCSGW